MSVERPAEAVLREAVSLHQGGRVGEALVLYRRVLEARPDDAEALHFCGLALFQSGDAEGGAGLVEAALARRPGWAEAHSNLGNILNALGRHGEAEAACRRAIGINPGFADAHNNLGNALKERSRLEEAIDAYRRAVELKPGYAEAFSNLGVTLQRLGRLEEALAACRRAIEIGPGSAGAYYNLGVVEQAGNNLEAAEAAYRQAVRIKPAYLAALVNLGIVLQMGDRLDEAETVYRRALEVDPEDPRAHGNLGAALHRMGRLEEAEAACRRAIEIAPDNAEAHSNLGIILQEQGKLEEAEAASRRALELNPDFADAHCNLGNVLQKIGRFDEAVSACRRALALRPDYAEAHNNLGVALNRLDRFEEAEAAYRRALEINPDFALAHNNLGNVLRNRCRLEEAEESFRRALALKPDYAEAHSNLIFSMDFDPHHDLAGHQAERRRWAEVHARPLEASIAPHPNPPDPERRLRVGYVSADFRGHSAALSFDAMVLNHDPSRFEVVCYSGTAGEDEMTARFRAAAALWRPTAGLSDEALAARIRADGIDILVDLAGFSAGNRLLVFARKPAPVQVANCTASGLPTMDYILTDRVLVPAGEADQYPEEIVYLPCAIGYLPPGEAPEVSAPPAREKGHVTFGCLNRLSKVSQEALALWAKVLDGVPGSRLLLKAVELSDGGARRRVLEALSRLGIGEDRVELAGKTSHRGHLETYGRVDLVLDPFPAGGGVTTFESLWMGVPAVSLLGGTVSGRISASIMTAVGLEPFVAGSRNGYLEICVAAARDLEALAATRAGLREKMAATALGDARRYAAAVEDAYRTMWRNWCVGVGGKEAR